MRAIALLPALACAAGCKDRVAPAPDLAPVITEVSLSPTSPGTDDVVRAAVEASDPEGRAVDLVYAWSVDGASVPVTGDALDGVDWFERGQSIELLVIPSDGKNAGDPVAAGPIEVQNSAPAGHEVAIDPAAPAAGESDLRCVIRVDAVDPDGDAVDYALSWTLDGAPFEDTIDGGAAVHGARTIEGQTWGCEAIPSDSTTQGASASATATVGPGDGGWGRGEVSLNQAGVTWFGDSAGDKAGRSVAGGGDVDGDGVPDLIIGADREDSAGVDAGAVYLISGGALGAGGALSGAAAAALYGEAAGDFAGAAVAFAGDVDGDGRDDLIVGAYGGDGAGEDAGSAYLIASAGLGVGGDLSGLGVRLDGEAAGDFAGYALSGAGDIDGDGLSEVLVGAPWSDAMGANSGRVYLVFGADVLSGGGGLADVSAPMTGEDAGDQAGWSVAGGGDVDQDGIDDVLVGAYARGVEGPFAGGAYLVRGAALSPGEVLNLADADWLFTPEDSNHFVGYSVSVPGDMDGDGYPEVAIGAIGYSDHLLSRGATYVVSGGGLDGPGEIPLAGAEHRLIGEFAQDYSGVTVRSAGDWDEDGGVDLLIGAYGRDAIGVDAGAAYLVLSDWLDAPGTRSLADAEVRFLGEGDGDYAGWSVAGAGDLNGDGFGEILVGVQRSDVGGEDAGAAALMWGGGAP